MSVRTEETRADLARPCLDREPPEADCSSGVDTPADFEGTDVADMEDQATNLMARLAWPEPPHHLRQKAEATKKSTGPISRSVAKLSRSVDGLSKSVAGLPIVHDRSAFWQFLAGGVLVAVAVSLVLAHRRADMRQGSDPSVSAAAMGASSPVQAAPRPALFVTASTPHASSPIASPTPGPAIRAGIDVLKLPVAPRRSVTPPPPRPRRAATSARSSAGTSVQTTPPAKAQAPRVDDGF